MRFSTSRISISERMCPRTFSRRSATSNVSSNCCLSSSLMPRCDTIVSHLGIKLEDKQQLLETFDVAERLEKVLGHMRSEMEILEVEKRIRSRVKKQMEKTQKEYYLNE